MKERIEIIGNERVSGDTILYYLSSKEGDYFSRELLKKDFLVFSSTGFFADIKIAAEDGAGGKLVKITVDSNKDYSWAVS